MYMAASLRWPVLAFTVIASIPESFATGDDTKADPYPDHSRLFVYADEAGTLQPVTLPEDWTRRRTDILAGMQAAMGPLPVRERWPDIDLKRTEVQRGEGYTRTTYTFAVEYRHEKSAPDAGSDRGAEVDRLPIDLYVPDGVVDGERRPAVLALHPTGALGKRIVAGEGPRANRQYAVELAQRGYVVLAPDYPSFGDYADYDFAADDYVSGTMKGIVNHRRCVDLLQSLPQVDPERIGVIGHSLGGHNAMFVATFDERIKVIVSSCGWDPFHHYYGGKLAGWTSDRYMPRIRDVYDLDPDQVPFDFYEVVAALAPRPFLSCSPTEDSNFDVNGVEKAIKRARDVYQLLGAEDALQLRTPKCGHDFPTEMRQAAYAFIDDALKHEPTRGIDYSAELPRIEPLSTDEAVESFETLPGYEIQQTAAEPLVVDPIAMCFDARGRLYVIEMRDYSEQDQERLGRVRLLTDTDGDGRFDESVVFADDLSWPTAIICYDDGVFVGAPPELMYLKDHDGDDQADERRVLFTGFSRSNVQGMMNSLRWGLDNRIHGATGTTGGVITRPDVPDFEPVNLRGRDFSFDPRKLDLRPESGGAQHGMCFDDWGRKFVCSNSDHCQVVMYEDRYIARNPDYPAPGPRVSIAVDGGQAPVYRISPVEPWRIVRTRLRASGVVRGVVEGGGRPAGYFTGATGITIYRGNALPDLKGMAIVGDVGSNLVHRKKLIPDGVGYKAVRTDKENELLRSKDIWFRPVQFAHGPDGGLHILDMYREVIEHPKSLPPEIKQHLDLTSGRDRGRLYRIVQEGFLDEPLPEFADHTVADLMADPNPWRRDTAGRLVFERRNDTVEQYTRHLFEHHSDPLARVKGLYALQGLDKLTPDDVLRALRDEHPRMREHALRAAEAFVVDPEVQLAATLLSEDPDRLVRYQAAFTAGELPVKWRTRMLVDILKQDGNDRWVRVAALSSLADGAGTVLAELLRDGLFLREAHSQDVIAPLARLVGRQNRETDLSTVLAAVQFQGAASSGASDRVLLEMAVANPKLRRQLDGTPSGELLEGMIQQARSRVADETLPSDRRAAAARLLRLADWSEVGDLLTNALDHRQPSELQSAAVEVLGTFADPAATAVMLDEWPRLSPSIRKQAEETVCTRTAGVLALLDRLEAGSIQLSDISPGRLQLLQASKNADIKSRATELRKKLTISTRQQVVEQYRDALARRGDVERGRAVFKKNCAACHKLENVGYELGPNLATIRNRGPEAILLNVLDPNREVNPQFQSYLAVTADGLTHTGMIQSETATAVTLSRGENKTETILRSEIEELRSTGLSLMPEGLEKEIDVAGMADLLAYLEGVR